MVFFVISKCPHHFSYHFCTDTSWASIIFHWHQVFQRRDKYTQTLVLLTYGIQCTRCNWIEIILLILLLQSLAHHKISLLLCIWFNGIAFLLRKAITMNMVWHYSIHKCNESKLLATFSFIDLNFVFNSKSVSGNGKCNKKNEHTFNIRYDSYFLPLLFHKFCAQRSTAHNAVNKTCDKNEKWGRKTKT